MLLNHLIDHLLIILDVGQKICGSQAVYNIITHTTKPLFLADLKLIHNIQRMNGRECNDILREIINRS